MTLLIVYATISIFFSFLCSILEAVLLSITPTFINLKKQEGSQYAIDLEVLKMLSGLKLGDTINVPGEEITDAIKKLWKQSLFQKNRTSYNCMITINF